MKDSQFFMLMAWVAICQCVAVYRPFGLIFLAAGAIWYICMAFVAKGGESK